MKSHLSGLATKLILSIFVISSALTTIMTAGTLYVDYNDELELHNSEISKLNEEIFPRLAKALGASDQELLSASSESLLRSEVVTEAIVRVDGQSMTLRNNSESNRFNFTLEKRIFPLVVNIENQDVPMGELVVSITKEPMLMRLLRRTVVFFCSQFLKTLLAAFLVYLVIDYLVTRHLRAIASFLEHNASPWVENWKDLKLVRKKGQHDELDSTVESVNKMGRTLEAMIIRQRHELIVAKKELSHQQDSAEHSARLVSLGEVAGCIGHEINSPVSAITATTRLLIKQLSEASAEGMNQEKTLAGLKRIEETSVKVISIVRGLLTLSREGSKDPKTHFTVEPFLKAVLSICEPRVLQSGVDIDLDIRVPKNYKFYAKEGPLSQVIINLLINAFDAIEETKEKWIRLEVQVYDEAQIIRVIDSGKGVKKEEQDLIFETFYTTNQWVRAQE